MHKQAHWLFSFSLIMLTPLSNLGTDIYTPSLPFLVNIFHTTNYLIQLSITIYFIFYGMGQLVFGSVSDYVGRKKILIFGIVLFTIACFFTVFITNVWLLLYFRMLQGIGAAIVSVITKAMISDSYSGATLQDMANYKVTLQIASMVFAPLIGGAIQQLFNWSWNFIFLAAYGFIGLWFTYLYIPETIGKTAFNFKSFKANLLKILFNRKFMLVTLITTIIYVIAASIGIFGSFYIQDVLKHDSFTYGLIALVLGTFYMLGSLAFKVRFLKSLIIPDKYLFLSSGIFMGLAKLWPANIYVFVISISIIMFFSGYLLPSIMGAALQVFKGYAGIASALYGTLVMVGTSIILSTLALINLNNALAFAVLYFLFSICTLLLIKLIK